MAKPKKPLSKKPAAVAARKARRAAKKAAPAAAKKSPTKRKAAKKVANPGTTLVAAAPFASEKFRCYGVTVALRKGRGPRGFCKRAPKPAKKK
jgi:hypothetical protein